MPKSGRSLLDLEMHTDFIPRHIGPDENQIDQMLTALGLRSLDELVDRTLPSTIISEKSLDLTESMSERDTLSYLRQMSERNRVFVSMIGMGYYGTVTPPVILRNVLEHAGWFTPYTPYQAEISQGRLEALLNFQQVVMDLTGLDLANSSLLDEATAAAEAMAMSKRVSKSKSNTFLVSQDCHPQTISVIQTRAEALGLEVVVCDPWQEADGKDYFGVIVQYPGSTGEIRDITPVVEHAHNNQALVTVATDLLALTLIKPPGEMGADIAIGSAQRFGVPMGYGGPHAAFFATRESYKRSTPGRIIGVSKDSSGKPALRMALQTREQHIRREKATSNICTSQALLAVMASFYAVYHGPDNLRYISNRVHRLALILVEGLRRLGFEVVTQSFFDTISVTVPGQANRIAARARESRINLRVIDADHLGISIDQTTRRRNVSTLWEVFSTRRGKTLDLNELDAEVSECIPDNLYRTSDFMTHPVFHLYHSETEMQRYLRRLVNKDIALNRSMIPLGSCTMKLNASSEMIPVTWRQFSSIHPFAPLDQTQGYQQLFEELEEMLCEATGYDNISFQPNAGSQGEYAGLLAIRKYHESQDQAHRDICLIPASAHGTNPASAQMAGLKVVVVASDSNGNVDVEDLTAKAHEHSSNLAALMITYPSTHGVFEEAIRDICAIVHEHGGQVYMDGANLNALVGICKPGHIGSDVSHLNLHKTFCIPHGGGGPGMGPIGVKAHLAPYLPGHDVVDGVNPVADKDHTMGPISAAPWSSASILPISWAYITMMGASGLKRATQVAILNANYVRQRLADSYPVLYTGKNGMVAHECIVDLRQFKKSCAITVDDVAKRLVDYGFHAPTMSFPVADTLMIEPTESESKFELDRFCDAMIAIRKEIEEVESGKVDAENSVLRNAPHIHEILIDEWDRPYSKQQAYFPLDWLHEDKYWPPVGRIDNMYGDKNLICSCPPLSAYED